jgi:hypothetical protein
MAASASCRIGSGSGFWGDMVDPAVELIVRGEVSYIGFDLLAELTVSILQRSRLRDPALGHIPDLGPILREALPAARRHGVRIVTNGGGANPLAGGLAAAREACSLGLGETRVATLEGDELTDQLREIRASGWKLSNLDTGEQDIERIAGRIVAAHAYTGCEGIIEALAQDAEVVVGGRLADSALYCGPLMHELGWSFEGEDWERIGAALTVGHILECAGVASGGMSTQWRVSREPWRLGFPLAEVCADGTAVIEKVAGSGGVINQWTVKEHLLYEVHDPFEYLLPDGIVDLGGVEVHELGPDRVRVTGMSGRRRPDTLKVQIGFEDGWMAESRAGLPWPDVLEKADFCERLVRERLRYLGIEPLEQRYDRVGVDALAGPAAPMPFPVEEVNEVELRMVIKTRTREEAEIARRALLLPGTAGPAGTAFFNPAPVRRVIGLWPTLVPRELVVQRVRVATARELVDAAA